MTRRVLGCCLLVAIVLLYSGLNTNFSFHFAEKPGVLNYGMLSEAFLEGQLHLKQQVDPRRRLSEDPLNPGLPFPYIYDAIIWNGRYYFQQEPLPAIFRAIWTRLTGRSVPTGIVVATCAVGIFLWIGLILWTIRRNFFPNSPTWLFWYAWLSFGLSGPQLYIASRPVVYHEAVAMGCFFFLGGAFFLFSSLTSERRTLLHLGLSGLFFGAAAASRAILILYPICFFMILFFSWAARKKLGRTTIKRLFVFVGPVAVFAAGLLIYNYLRFGDFLDFGRTHIVFLEYIDYVNVTLKSGYFSLKRIPFQLYQYLLSGPLITERFAYVRYPAGRLVYGDVYIIKELVCSIFITAPVLLLLLPLPFLFRYSRDRGVLPLILLGCAVSPACVLIALSASVGVTARYFCDFVPLLFIIVFYDLAVMESRRDFSPVWRRVRVFILVALFAANIFMGLILGRAGITQALVPNLR